MNFKILIYYLFYSNKFKSIFGWKIVPNLRTKIYPKSFWAVKEFCKIDPCPAEVSDFRLAFDDLSLEDAFWKQKSGNVNPQMSMITAQNRLNAQRPLVDGLNQP
jgi:hypothetical protein